MLRELRVIGYRSLRQIALELSPLTVVVGANGTGKTNLYQALRLVASAAQGTLAQDLAAQGGLPSAMWAGPRRKQESHRIELWIDLEDLAFELQLGVMPPPQGAFALDPDVKEELLAEARARLGRWRFYHAFRTDADAPARQPQVGVRTPALAHDGRDLAAALMTIREIGD